MPIITHDRPDPRFYVNITQGDDGNWSADQMNLEDVESPRPAGLTAVSKGLRSVTQDSVDSFSAQSVLINAPPDMQRNGLAYMPQHAAGDPLYDKYYAMFTWINAMNTYRDSQKAAISTMTFDQLTTYIVNNQGWPPLPSNMPPASFSTEGLTSRVARKP
jgi:hypothetical protein